MTRLIILALTVVLTCGAQSIRWGQIRTSETGVFNVKTSPFNAKGDGTTDDTAAIKAALVAGAGKTVRLPPGNYKVISTLTPAANTTIEGAGHSMAEDSTMYATRITFTSLNTPLFNVAVPNVRISGLQLVQSGTAVSGSVGIKVTGGAWGTTAMSGRISDVSALLFYNGFILDDTGGLFTCEYMSAHNSKNHGIIAKSAQGFWHAIDSESSIGSGLYVTTSSLGGSVSPMINGIHTYANARYGIEVVTLPITMISQFYSSHDSLGAFWSSGAGSSAGSLSDFWIEYTGVSPWSNPVYPNAATNANPIEITTTAAHGWTGGESVDCYGITTNTAANGTFTIAYVSPTKFTLNGSTGSGVFAPTDGCIATPSALGCARCSLSTEVYRSLPTAPAITLPAGGGPLRITDGEIFNPNGEGILSAADYTYVDKVQIDGAGASLIPANHYGIKTTGYKSRVSGVLSNTACYVAGSDVIFTDNSCIGTDHPAIQIASGDRVIASNNSAYHASSTAMQIDAGVTMIHGRNNVNGTQVDSTTTRSAASQDVGFKTTYAALGGSFGYCTNCKVTSGTDNTCTNGGAGALFWFDIGTTSWRCVVAVGP